MGIYKQHLPTRFTGNQFKTISAGKEVPRTELKIDLPLSFHSVGNSLNGMAQHRAAKAYEKIGRSLPSRLSVPELMVAKKTAENPTITNPEFFRARAIPGMEFDVVSAEFYKRSVFLEWHHLNDVRRFFSQKQAPSIELSVHGSRFIIREEGDSIVAERSIRNTLQASLSEAISIIHLRDMMQACSLSAAAKYASASRTLRSPEMRGIIQPLFSFLSKDGENPKMELPGRLLSERQGRRCLIICETGEQTEVLRGKFPGVAVTNHPKKGSMAGFETIILYNPTNHSVEAAWKAGACEIIVLVAKGTSDEERYWQNSKEEDAKRKPGIGSQLSFLF
ncbi:MAG: hypothetical protein WC861_01800 [Candidatus Micrarchaeia archaeon]|jgi:hypothetical protein